MPTTPAPTVAAVPERYTLIREIQTIISDKLAVTVSSADDDLLDSGILDSAALVRLVLTLEERFELRFPMSEIGSDSFRSVTNIADLVAGQRNRLQEPDPPPSTPLPEQDYLIGSVLTLFAEELNTHVKSADEDLFQTGVLDSMRLVEFILVLEQRFGLRFPIEDLEINSGISVAKLAELAGRAKRSSESRLNEAS